MSQVRESRSVADIAFLPDGWSPVCEDTPPEGEDDQVGTDDRESGKDVTENAPRLVLCSGDGDPDDDGQPRRVFWTELKLDVEWRPGMRITGARLVA